MSPSPFSVRRPATALAATVLALGALALAGCSADASASGSSTPLSTASKPSGTITLYTSEPQDKATEIIQAFTAEYPAVKVELYRAGTGDLAARIAAEQKAGGVKGDLLWAADSGTFDGYAKQGLLEKFTPPEAADVEKDVVDPNGYYVGTRIIPTVIAYNTTQIKTPPASWADLADGRYRGKIVMPNPDVSGAAAYNAAVWYKTGSLGQSWFEALGKNKPVIADSNGPVSQAVATGTQPVGVVVDYLVRDLAKQGSPVAVAYPSEGVPSVSEPIGVFSSSANKAAAEAFEGFVLSKAGQKLAVKQDYLPVREDAGSPEGAPALSSIKTLTPDAATIADAKSAAIAAFKAAVGG